jgi:hypothetical protein
MEQPSHLRSLAEFCRSYGWRRRKAEYDRDERNLRTAAALEELAAYVTFPRTTPPARPEAAGRTGGVLSDRACSTSLAGSAHQPDTGLDPFLDRLVTLASRSGESGRFGGRCRKDDPWA